jgi:maltooligosyltrehalose trehalohydrolase
VVFAQNHDQIGNRAYGDRLSTQVSFEALKVAAAAVLLSPNIPLLFMGEEYGETAPFLYFIDHGDPALVEAVRQGRRREFASFAWAGEIPDPQDPRTFEQSRLQPGHAKDIGQKALLQWTRRLIELRTTVPALGAGTTTTGHQVWAYEKEQVLALCRRESHGPAALLILGFNSGPASVMLREPVGRWRLHLDSSDPAFLGQGRDRVPHTLAVIPEGAALIVPAYTVAVFLQET